MGETSGAIGTANQIIKRVLDVTMASILLLLCLPVIGVVAFMIKCQDGGPVLYRRRVVGAGGEFDALKLRSMFVGADRTLDENLPLRTAFRQNFKLKDDPRITRFGRVIRRLSLDELPQLFNILRGQMSLIGPRMITSEELEKFGEARWIFRKMKPGLTGYWQVYGRQDVSYARRVEMELYYVENWSLRLDLKILMKTPLAVLRGAGAY
jgi:lipopolysaccharide/colanic/teichoic acid biosynthesis glycosyltransferase